MSKTVYVEVTSSYSRSTWDDLGSTNYNPGDRVDYFDGSRNRIFVCINSNNSTTEPQNNPTDWAPAGSKEYPFLLIDSATNLRVINNSEWTLHGISSSTVNFLAEELGTWAPDNPIGGNATYQADGAGGTIILGDGRYAWDYPTYAMWWPNNCTIQAKNKQKAYIITTGNYWGGDNVTWKDVVIYCTKTSNNTPGGYGGFTHNLDSCLFTQETPWGSLYAAKQEPSSSLWTRVCGGFNGGYMRNCTFDYQYRGPSYWFNLSATSTGTIENNTFYCRVKHNQYNLIYGGGNVLWSNNIFHIKYLQNGHPNQVVHQSAFSGEVSGLNTQGVNTFYLENDSDVGGTLNNNINGGVTIDPKFVDQDSSNFSLRPSSPLIGGFKSSNPAGVYIQPGSGTGGSGTFDDPYYMGELGVAETEAAAGEGIIYFVDGEYIVSTDLNFYADEITYKSLNKHKAILGRSSASTTSAVRINVGGAYGATNLGVGNITLEDFYLKNSRFQLVSNDLSRPNKLTGLKVIDTLPVTHATDGVIWSQSSACIIKSCLFYTDFAVESNHYLGRGYNHVEVYDSTMIIKFSNPSGHIVFPPFKSFENSIVYGTTAGIPESGFPAFTAASKDCCFHNIGSNSTYGGENTYQGDPKFVDASSKDFRLRADSPLIGGVNKSKYPMDSVWVQSGTGIGAGTEDDPFYWDEYPAAFLAATQSSSKQLIFKDGTYIWTNAILQDDNVGNNITMVAENMHQAIFTDNDWRLSSAGKNPTLRFKNIKLLAIDHFTHLPECHYVFNSIHLLCNKQVGALSVTATGSIFEVATGQNTSIFNNSGPVNIRNCIFTDHNDRSPTQSYLTDANSGIIKNTIFYAKYPRADCIRPGHSAVLISCASENITNQRSGIEYFNNLGFMDVENKDYNLRPLSPLIGQGK
jgi:hypothetical protein